MKEPENRTVVWIAIAVAAILLCLMMAGIVLTLSRAKSSNGNTDNSAQTNSHDSLEYFAEALEAEFDLGERDVPAFQNIGAINGVIWQEQGKVAIYEYETEASLEQAFEDFPIMGEQSWVTNGRFVLETGISEIRDFFNTIE